MRKRIAFRALVILLAATVLLSSTGAYNILAYTDMEAVANSLSAISREQSGASAVEPTITECGGELINIDDKLPITPNAAGTALIGSGTLESPYQIGSVADFLEVNRYVNDATGTHVGGANVANKHFILTADIDISSLTSADFVNPVSGSGCFITTDGASSPNVYIKLDGNGHKIIGGGLVSPLSVTGHENTAVFGYLGSNSEIRDVVFENISINVTYATPREVAIISYKNDGRIIDCSVKNCTINVTSNAVHPNPYYDVSVPGGVRRNYNGIAGGVADNAGEISNLTVDGLKITINGADDYIGGVAGQNRGFINGCSIYGIKITANGLGNNNNENIGGIAGLNVSGPDTNGVQNCRVDMQGVTSGYTNNFTKGNIVGGLIGLNEGYLYNSSVTGSIATVSTPTAASYNMLGFLSSETSYFGGAVGKNNGENAYIKNCTVSDVGFYMDALGNAEGYYGGITPIITKAAEVEKCVATGSFASQNATGRVANCYAGGIIARMDTTTPAAATIADCYALYKLRNPSKNYVGAVIGFGGSPSRMVNCYWSDEVSGCVSSYYETMGDIVLGLEAIAGNLTASKRAVKVMRNTVADSIPASQLTHSWNNGGAVTVSVPSSALSITTNHPENSIAKHNYTAAVNMNSSGIGSSDKSSFDVAFCVDVFIASYADGDPGDIDNPLAISSSAQASFIQNAPYAHYELDGDVSVSSSSSWAAPMFTGTINGNGYRIYADCTLFKAVIGNRTGGMGSAIDTTNRVTNPATDATANASYRSMGVVSDLTVELASNITSAVFGSIYNATFINVSLSDSNPEPAQAPLGETGSRTIPDTGYLANLSKERTAAFINAAYGNSYIYGCSSDVSATISSGASYIDNNDIAAFIAFLGGAVTVDNCYLSADVYINNGGQNTGRAAFLGNIVNNTGYILNSCISSAIYYMNNTLTNHCFVVANTCGENNVDKLYNIVWADSQAERSVYLASPVNTSNSRISGGVRVWGSNTNAYIQNTKISVGGTLNFNVAIPQNTDAFTNIAASEILVTSEDSSAIEVVGWTIQGTNLVVTLRDGGTSNGNSIWVKIEHTSSGMKTYASFIVASGLTMGDDGYYHIPNAAVFKEVVGLIRSGDSNNGIQYSASAYKIDADIDLSYYDGSDAMRTMYPIVGNGSPFTGIFTSDTNSDGTPKYTISGLTINQNSGNVALFSRVDFSGTVLVNGVPMPSGISNIAIDGASITGRENVAVLIGSAVAVGTSGYGSLPISNVTITNSTVISGTQMDTIGTGRHAGVVVASVENCNFDIEGITLEDNTVYTYNTDNSDVGFASAYNSYTKALGGVIGYFNDTTMIDDASECTIKDVRISGLKLSGAYLYGDEIVEGYAPAHAGAVLGSYQRVVLSDSGNENRTIIIGDSTKLGTQGEGYDDYDIFVEDAAIMVEGIAGGVVGVSSASTIINNACVRGTTALNTQTVTRETAESAPMRILSNTKLYIGGIVGYAGAYRLHSLSVQSSNLDAVSSVINNSTVENAVVMATDESFIIPEYYLPEQLERNVVLGGIAGSINGLRVADEYDDASDFRTVESCTLKNSYLYGLVLGGMVGTVSEWFESGNYEYNELLKLHIGNCSVEGSKITTPEACCPLYYISEDDRLVATNGVGGILGTNRRNENTYSAYTVITDCTVDGETSIENYTPYSYTYYDTNNYEDISAVACSATGGILGSGFVANNFSYANKTLRLNRNRVDATIRSTAQIADSNYDDYYGNTFYGMDYGINSYYLSVGTGGMIGMLNGLLEVDNYFPDENTGCLLSSVKVNRSVFGGKIYGTDCIGGIIGTVSAAYSDYYSDNYWNESFIGDAVITGELYEDSSFADSDTCHGGIVIGHVVFRTGTFMDDKSCAFESYDGEYTDTTPFIRDIYYSSFGEKYDPVKFPLMGYLFCGDYPGTGYEWDEVYAATDEYCYLALINSGSYYDVNMPNYSYSQYDAEVYVSDYMDPPVAPTTPVGFYMIESGTEWESQNTSVISVETDYDFAPVLTSLHSGSPEITIKYTADASENGFNDDVPWERPALEIGFIATTEKESGLSVCTVDGVDYYLIRNEYDMNLIGKELGTNGFYSFTADGLSRNYWITNDITIPEEMYATGSTFGNGFMPVGTASLPFTGTFTSAPGGTYTYETSDGNTGTLTVPNNSTFKISNLNLGVSNAVSGLFGYVEGNGTTQLSNFTLENVSGEGSSACSYMGAVAARVTGSVSVENITIINPQLTGANYTGGMFGGFFYGGTGVPTTSLIKACRVEANTADTNRINIGARMGAAGIIAHTSQYYTDIKGVTVKNLTIYQTAATQSATYDHGAAGISLAYSGSIAANGSTRNTVDSCTVKGEVASGAVTRTYNSNSTTDFVLGSYSSLTTVYSTNNGTTPGGTQYADFSIQAVDIINTDVEGTGTYSASTVSQPNSLCASAGILAVIDDSSVQVGTKPYVKHYISDCTLDKDSSVTAQYSAGGIVGCISEEAGAFYVNVAKQGVSIDNCKVFASITTTVESMSLAIYGRAVNLGAVGCGGIIGFFGKNVPLTLTNITNCVIGGSINANFAGGGIIGGIWNDYRSKDSGSYTGFDKLRLSQMDSHFVSDCVVSAEFKLLNGNNAFGSTTTNWFGLVLGALYDGSSDLDMFYSSIYGGYSLFSYMANVDGFTDDNFPFYNIYFSEYDCPSGKGLLFGRLNGVNDGAPTATRYTLNSFEEYTQFCYDLNDKSYTINSGNGHTVTTQQSARRIGGDNPGIIEFNYMDVVDPANPYFFDIADDVTFNSAAGTGFNANCSYVGAASIHGFSVKGAAVDSPTVSFTLESVDAVSESVHITHISGTSYSISCDEINSTLNTRLVFTYTNGLKLYATLKINRTSDDYWYIENNSKRTYLVFNALNLKALGGVGSDSADYIQCFDVFWTLDDQEIADAVNNYISEKTLGEVYDAAFVSSIVNYNCPNPDYDPINDPRQEITFNEKYITSGLYANAGAVKLSELVGDISTVGYGVYSEDLGASIYNGDGSTLFTGTYTSNAAPAALRSGALSDFGSTYVIYGLDIRYTNTVSGNDAQYAGMFDRIGNATISGITFIDPKIEIVGTDSVDTYAGILAGTAENATINNITLKSTRTLVDGENVAGGYVKSLKLINPANSYVGGVCGALLGSSTVNGLNIGNIDVFASVSPRNINGNAKQIYAGGVAGISTAAITGDGTSAAVVENCGVYVERETSSAAKYLAYAGGIAGAASGTIGDENFGIEMSNMSVGACETEVTYVDGNYGSCEYKPHLDVSYIAADRIGGVVGLANGDIEVINCNLPGLTATAFDTTGGIIGEVAGDSDIDVTVIGCNVGSDSLNADIRTIGYGNASTAARKYYNAAGGIVGEASLFNSLSVSNCEFNGYVGVSRYDLVARNCTAGGIIGVLNDVESESGYLDRVTVYSSTVQGSVVGYRKDIATESQLHNILEGEGVAGGIIGKIYNYGTKTASSSNGLISDCIMSAELSLYSNNGVLRNPKPTDPASENSYVGKIIGEIKSSDQNDTGDAPNFANLADGTLSFTDYVSNVYVSSYPQDINAYGSKEFYSNLQPSNTAESTYTDINKAVVEVPDLEGEGTHSEYTNSFNVGGSVVDLNDTHDYVSYASDTYSDTAVITFDSESAQATDSSRNFRLSHDGITVGDKEIAFAESMRVVSTDASTADIDISEYSGNYPDTDEYFYGVLTVVSESNEDIVGSIVAEYSYGLETSVTFVSMEIEGNGSENNPFVIKEARHFKVVRALTGAYYVQGDDIDLSSQYDTENEAAMFNKGTGFDPLGSYSAPFVGEYDGNGYAIKNLYISNKSVDGIGFFGYVGNNYKRAILENIHIELSPDGVIGRRYVGGLIGICRNASVTNCSVVDGFVMGETGVGGLVGNSDSYGSANTYNSCFTSTNSHSYFFGQGSSGIVNGAGKNVGALIGITNAAQTLNNCFTIGYADVGSTIPYSGNPTGGYGAAGGVVGCISTGAVAINDCFVGAAVSDYVGVSLADNYYRGFTVGYATSSTSVTAANVTVAAPRPGNDGIQRLDNPILSRGTSTLTNVRYDSTLMGTLNGSESATALTTAQLTTDGKYTVDIGSIDDPYTLAYADLASLPITVDRKEISEREISGEDYQYSGLVFPISIQNLDGSIEFSSSKFDDTDIVDYPDGLDNDMYGIKENGVVVDKQTDVLFRDNDETGTTTVYRNTYSRVASNPSVTGGITTGFKCNSPFIYMNKPLQLSGGRDFNLVRTVVYPFGNARIIGNTICTARQLAAMSNPAENETGSKFAFIFKSKQQNNNFALTADIFLDSYSFNPIVGFKGNFEGNGFTIDRLKIDGGTDNEIGLFRTLSTGSIKNLSITVDAVRGGNNVGALVGALVASDAQTSVSVIIENCSVALAQNGENEAAAVGVKASGRNVGGLVGAAMRCTESSGIRDSHSSVTVDGKNVVGGLVGYCEQPVVNSYAVGKVVAEFNNTAAVTVSRWDVTGAYTAISTTGIPVGSTTSCGVGGLIGVLHTQSGTFASAKAESCFFAQGDTDGQVVVTTASGSPYVSGYQYGVGGLVGIDNAGASIATSFSSGNVYFSDGQADPASTSGVTVGVGGLSGVTNNPVYSVYSCSAVRAYFGNVTGTVSTGVGGVVGVANGTLSQAYSSGSIVGETSTSDTSSTNFGAGGVLGVAAAGNSQYVQLYYDINVSAVTDVIGKLINNSSYAPLSVKPLTTDYMTTDPGPGQSYLGESFGYVNGAYPYLNLFFGDNVSTVITMNALLSIVAVRVDELDVSAATGHGVSMALRVPTSLTYLLATYNYDFDAQNSEDTAQAMVDMPTNTLSFQRTTNASEDVNTRVRIVSKTENGITETGDDSGEYADLASRTISLSCAGMYGTQESPYLVSSQADVEHMGMNSAEYALCADSFYREWVTPINTIGEPVTGKVYFRLMGYIDLDGSFNRTIPQLEGQTYGGITFSGMSVDGNGYSIRNLENSFVDTVDTTSVIKNLTFENVNLGSGEHIANTVKGTVEGVNVYGSLSGSNAAAIAGTVDTAGLIKGCVADVNYSGDSASNVAGIALTNNGTIELSASVGSFAGSVNGLGAMVVNNSGTIRNSFTMGNIYVAYGADTGIGGFVANNTGTISDCYTRCNIDLTNCTSSSKLGSFAAVNNGSISRGFAAGRFNVSPTESKPEMSTLFAGSGSGSITDCMYDKQIAGKCYYDVYNNAERTLDIINLSNHSTMQSSYSVSTPDFEGGNYRSIYYPQLKAILGTYGVYTSENIPTGLDESMIGEETPLSRMYRVLRGYSFISSAAALTPGDNYIDNLPLDSKAALSYDLEHTNLWKPLINIGQFGETQGDTKGRYIAASGTFTATNPVKDYYNRDIANPTGLDIVANITSDGHPNFAGGSGTQDSPFTISTPEQFVALSYFGTNADNNFRVINDINMSGADWARYIDNFRANLDGNGMAVSNITIADAGNNSVFGNVDGGVITSLALAGVSVTSNGGVAGLLASTAADATITDCVVVGELEMADAHDNSTHVGGLIGLAENTAISGCVTSGKIVSDGTAQTATGGIVGTASGTTSLSDSTSTAFVDGGAGMAGGIIGAVYGESITVDNAVFANTVNAGTAHNIVGSGTAAITNAYFDKQFSVVPEDVQQDTEDSGKSTHYLTVGATTLPTAMTRVDTVNGSYPVAASVAGGTKSTGFMTALKLASLKIQLFTGIGGVGTVENFTKVDAPSTVNGVNAGFSNVKLGEKDASLIPVTPTTSIGYTTNTSGMKLDDSEWFGVTYALEGFSKLARYMQLNVNKLIYAVEYNIEDSGVGAGDGAVLTVFTKGSSSAMAVSAFAATAGERSQGTLCRDMVFAPGVDGYILNARCELPSGKKIASVSAEIYSGSNKLGEITSTGSTASVEPDGLNAKFNFEDYENAMFDRIVITVTLDDDTQWGIRTINSLV